MATNIFNEEMITRRGLRGNYNSFRRIYDLQYETSAKLPGSAGSLPASGRFFNDSPAGSRRSQRGTNFC
jgi:hypothetical protein